MNILDEKKSENRKLNDELATPEKAFSSVDFRPDRHSIDKHERQYETAQFQLKSNNGFTDHNNLNESYLGI